MKRNRLLKTALGLLLAFAMTITPIFSSYVVVAAALDSDSTQASDIEETVTTEDDSSPPEVAETEEKDNTADKSEQNDQSVDEPVASDDQDTASDDSEQEYEDVVVPDSEQQREDAVEETEEETAEDEEEQSTKTRYVWKDSKVKVTAVLSDAEAVPDDAELVARPVVKGSSDYNYDAYMEALNQDEDSRYTEKNTLLYDIAFIKDGVEIQPDAGKVSVTFEFLDSQLSESIGAKKADDVNVIHLPLKDSVRDEYDTTSEAKKIDSDDIVVEALTEKENDLSVNVSKEKVSFETDSFSVFAYTVDFEYTDPESGKIYTYNLKGEGSITIRELAVILGITTEEKSKEFAANIENVEFSDETLVKVQKTVRNGWVLKSLAPFSSDETLTITMKDGSVIIVNVTDVQESPDLTNFVTNAVISGATLNADGKYEVESGKEYSIILSFAESSHYQFDNDATLTYQMPEGIKVLTPQSGPLKINIVYKGRTYQVDATYDLDTSGKLEIKFDESDPDYPRLEESTNVSFRFTYNAQFDGSSTIINFSDDVERDIVFDEPEPGQAYASKSATYDETTGIFNYTIKVKATGDVKNVNVKDVISGNALIFNNDVTVSGNSSSYTDNGAANGFDYTFASMKEGEEITITYSARVDFSKDTDKDGKITVDQTRNTVTVKPEGGDPHNSEYSREINFKGTKKGNGTEVGTTENGDKIIEWTIDYNPLALVAVGGDKITDRISAGSAEYMKYYGDGLSITKTDNFGYTMSYSVPYSNLTLYSDSSWTYTIPQSDNQPYHYIIKYKTIVDMSKVNGGGTAVTLDNTANDDHGTINVGPDNEISIIKDVESFTTEEVNWVSTLTVPDTGLTKAVVTDSVPRIWLNGENHYDIYKDGTLDIQGLLPGESYSVSEETGKVIITFYKDSAKQEPGLQATEGGHTITVRLTTKVDQEWLQKGYETSGYEQDHTNTIDFNGKQDTATVTYGKPDVKKTGDKYDDTSFRYTVVIAGASELPITVKDTFDTSLLEVDTSKSGSWDHMRIWGGNQWSQDAGRIPVSYTDDSDGITLTANSVPMQPDGNYYPYYKIVYYLKLKDGVDLEQLAIANGGEYDLVNTAKWGDHESSFTYKTEYDYLDKQLLNAGQIGNTNRKAQYQITFNRVGATLNEGEPMEMKDVLSSNLSIDYSSIKITTDPAGREVPYSISGGEGGTTVATYTVPDSTKVVITYDAFVRGSGSQTIVNKVSVNGKDETVENTKSYGSASEGQGAIASFKIVKVDGYDANKKLSGVQFKLFAENPDLSFDKEGTMKEVILTTDENGEATIDGSGLLIYFDECYHLQEVSTPENYGQISFDYLVTMTNDMSKVDYGHYIYYYNDSMQIKNWPLEGLVVEKQVESDVASDKDQLYKFRISILNDDGSVNTDYNEKNGDDQFENGVVEFELKDKEQKMFWGFLKGTKYKVEEIDSKGLATSVSYSIFDEDGNIIETKTEHSSEHTGALTQEDEVIVFKNSRTQEKGSLKIKKNVTVNGKATTGTEADGTYTFTIAGPNGYSSTQTITITNGVSKEVQVNDLAPGTYTITEDTDSNPDGMSLVGNNGVEVTVTANNTSDVPTAEFTNNKKEGKGEVKVKKTLSGRNWTTDDSFEFTITPVGNAPAFSPRTVTVTKDSADYTESFGEVTFIEAGTYQWIVSETHKGETIDGVAYDSEDKTVTIKVVDDGNGKLVADTDSALVQTAAFTNTYSKSGEGEVKVQKILSGKDWTTNDRFEFTITPVGNAPAFTPNTVTVTKDSEGYTESFGKVTFTEAGTYEWTVSETHKGETIDGVSYDSADKTITMVVKDDGKGNLVADEGSALVQTAVFTNTYSKSGKGEVKVQKNLTGRAWATDDSFEFTITPVGNAPAFTPNTVTVTKDSEGYTESFGEVTFTEAGTYEWTVSETHKGETINGVKYDTEDKTITIKIKDDGNGELIADGTPLVQTAEFTNTYSKSGKGEVKVQKNLTGRDWTTNDSFEFTITPVDNAPALPKNKVTVTKDSTDYTESFGKVTFTEAGTYQWTVSETHKGETIDGVVYDSADKTITMVVTDDGEGHLIAAEGSALVQTAAFTNTYSKSGKGEVKVQKNLTGRAWTTDDSFEFTITPVGKAPTFTPNTVTVTKDSEGYTESFGEVTFTEAGTYQWTVSETHKGETIDGVAYDSLDKTITIKVKDNGKGELIADGTPLVQTAAFTNTYSKSGKGEVKVKKTLSGKDWTTDDSFEFTITPVGDAPAFTPNKVTVNSETPDYTKSFGKVTFTEAGTYQWTVREKHKGETIDGVAYDSADKTVTITVKDDGKGHLVAEEGSNLVKTAAFTNTYSKSGKGEVKVQKNLTGREWATDDSFEFTITPVDNAPTFTPDTVTVTKDSEGYTESFGEVTFTEAGTYQWTVSETHKGETIDGVKYENADKTITIKVKDNGKGELIADGTPLVQTAAFTNNYSAEGEGEIKVKKTFTGRDWTDDDEFTFTLAAGDNTAGEGVDTPMPETTGIIGAVTEAFTGRQSITITSEDADADYTKSFGTIRFTKPGTYSYTVKETKGKAGGVVYDETDHTVTFTVVDDGKGHLVAEPDKSLIETVEISNTYSAKGEGEIKVQKVLEGRDWTTADSFGFTLSAAEGTPMPAVTSITITKADEDQIKSFGKIEYTKAGTYVYTVKETKGSLGGIVYDETDHTVTIDAVDDGKGHIVATADSSLIQTTQITNTYDAVGSITLDGTKALEGKKLTEGAFKFRIAAKDNAPLRDEDGNDYAEDALTVSNDAAGKFTFPEMWYKLTDLNDPAGKRLERKEFEYTVTEVLPKPKEQMKVVGNRAYDEDTGIIYDLSEKTVKITISDNGDGTLEVVRTNETDALGFVNKNRFTSLNLTKSINSIVKQDTKDELVNVTVVFKISYYDSFLKEKRTRTVSVQFDPETVTAETVTVDKIPADLEAEDITIEEVYSADYKGVKISGITKTTDENTGISTFSVEYTNSRNGNTTGSGVINTVDKNTFQIKNRQDSTGKNQSPPQETPR